MADETDDRCAFCGADVLPGTGLEVELLSRETPDDDEPAPEPVRITVCSHRHAARWLDGDDPPTATRLRSRAPLSWGDRVTVGLLGLALAVLVGLTLLGAWTAIGWLA